MGGAAVNDPKLIAWMTDPWFAVRMGEATAFKAGWEAARAAAAQKCTEAAEASDCVGGDWFTGRSDMASMLAASIAVMEPPA